YQKDLRLTPQLVWFISAILAHKWDADLPYPSLRRMAEETGVSQQMLHTYKKKLVEDGLLVILNRQTQLGGKDTNYYDFNPLMARLEELLRRDKGESSPSEHHLNQGGDTHLNSSVD